MCKTCHPNQPKLTFVEIQINRKQAAQNNNPKPKRCTKECVYDQIVIERSNKSIPIRTHIKIFKTWMKSKINHLLPIIAPTKGIFESWKNIRKVIFIPILNRLILPFEAVSSMG